MDPGTPTPEQPHRSTRTCHWWLNSKHNSTRQPNTRQLTTARAGTSMQRVVAFFCTVVDIGVRVGWLDLAMLLVWALSAWCSWLSHSPHTREVSSSILDADTPHDVLPRRLGRRSSSYLNAHQHVCTVVPGGGSLSAGAGQHMPLHGAHSIQDLQEHIQAVLLTGALQCNHTCSSNTSRHTQTHTDTHRHTQTHTETHRHTQTACEAQRLLVCAVQRCRVPSSCTKLGSGGLDNVVAAES